MLWAKLLLPILLVTAGGAAAVAATRDTSRPESVATAEGVVWIDNPAAGAAFAPGVVGVDAHSVVDQQIAALALYVDGDRVAVDDDLTTAQDLAYATFNWKADEGQHQLVVAQVGGDEARSEPRTVNIVDGAPAAPKATTTTTTEPGDTTTSSTTTTTAPGETATSAGTAPGSTAVTVAPTVGPTAPPVTVPPTAPATTAPPTTAPPKTPSIDDATVSSPSGDLTLYVRDCGYTVLVSATVRDATAVTATVEGTNVSGAMTRSGNTYRFTLRSGTFTAANIGPHRVIVTAVNGTSAPVTKTAGRVTVEQGCPKD